MKFIGRTCTPDEERWRIYNKIAVRILPLVFLGYTIASIDRMNVAFAKLQMGSDLGLSNTMYGFGAGIFFIGYCLFEIPSNMILHRVGARVWLARIMIMWGLLSAATMFVQTPMQFYVLRFLLGVSEAGFYPGALLYLTYWFPRYARSQAVSYLLLGTSFAAIVGGPLAGSIMQFLDNVAGLRGWQWVFLIEGLPASILGIIVLIVLKNRPAEASWLTAREKEIVIGDLAEDARMQASRGGDRKRFGDAFRNVNIWCLVFANFCNLSTLYGVQFWIPTIIERVARTSVFATGLVTAALAVVPATALILAARHSDKTGERRWHAAAGFLTSLVGLTLAGTFSDNAYLALTGLVLANCGVSIAATAIFALPATFVVGAAAAAAFALITTVGNLAGYASPFLIGVLRDATGGFSLAFYGLGAVALIGAIIILSTPALRSGSPIAPRPADPAPRAAGQEGV